jgi:RNA polymerase sigma-70 factor (ECF subfamily)
MTMPLDDESLARQARSDADSFAELYRRHVTQVYRYHLVHTGNEKDAEDLTSQTFLAALDGLARYRGAGVFAAWLMGIARRQMALFFRRRRPEAPLEQAEEQPASLPALDVLVGQRLALQEARAALKNLSPERAEALILVTFGGLSAAEAALTLGKSEAAVKMLVSRGLQDIRARVAVTLEVEA